MEERTKLYGAMSHARMEKGQMAEEHGYPEEHLDEHDLDDAEYEFGYMHPWEGEPEEEIVHEHSESHDLIEGQHESEEYTEEEFGEFVEFDNEEDAKIYIAKMESRGADLIGDEEEVIDETGEESHQYIEAEDILDHSAGPLYNMPYQHTTGRRATIHECEVCGVVVKHPSKIAAHMRTHTGEKPFHCDICGRSFTQRTPWRMHMKRHAQDLPFPCSSGCGKAFPNASQRNAHDLRHMGRPRQGVPRPHLKPQKRQFIPNDDIDDLMDDPPVIDVRDPFFELEDNADKRIDEVINAVAENREARLVPTKAKAPPPPPPPAASPTEDASPRRKKSRRAPPIVAECQICGLLLKHPSKIQAHMRSHSGVKLHKCRFCGLSVATNYALRMHEMRKHTEGERPLACQWDCGKRFVSVSAKNEHERIVHGGYKRYVCKLGGCYRLFARRTHYINHKLKDHPGITHVDEFDDGIDQDLVLSGLVEAMEEGTSYQSKEYDGDGEETDERHLIEGREEDGEREEREDETVMIDDDLHEVRMKGSPLERRKRNREESCSSEVVPPSTRVPLSVPVSISPSVPRQELSLPRSLPVVPRLNQMKIPRIVRPRGGRIQ